MLLGASLAAAGSIGVRVPTCTVQILHHSSPQCSPMALGCCGLTPGPHLPGPKAHPQLQVLTFHHTLSPAGILDGFAAHPEGLEKSKLSQQAWEV